MAYGWEGELIRLVPLDEDRHLENFCIWLNDPEVTANLLHGDFPLMRASERQFFEKMAASPESDIIFAIETLNGEHLGGCGLHRISYRHGFAHTGTFIGAKEHWGRGYGGDAVRTRTRYAFEVLGLRVLYSEYLEGNEPSRRMQERVGYRECGRFPKRLWKRGRFVDEVLTCCTRESWQEAVRTSQESG